MSARIATTTTVGALLLGTGIISWRTVRLLASQGRARRWSEDLKVVEEKSSQYVSTRQGSFADHRGQLSLTDADHNEVLLEAPSFSGSHTYRKVIRGTVHNLVQGSFHGHLGRTPRDFGLTYDNVDREGSAAWVIPPSHPTTESVWAIHAHGLHSERSQTLRPIPTLARCGITSVVPTYPLSPEYTVPAPRQAGLEAARVLKQWVDYAIEHGANTVLLVGWSLGAVPIHHILHEPDPKISGVILFSPVLNLRETVRRAQQIPRPLGALTAEMAVRISGWSRLRSKLKESPKPALIFCGETDRQIDAQSTLREAAHQYRSPTTVVFPQAQHTLEWNADPVKAGEALMAWCKTHARREKHEPKS